MKQKNRRALDAAVLEVLGLEPDRYLPHIYEGLVEMMEERLALPKLRATRKKAEKRVSLEQVKEQVRQEILRTGLKPSTAFLPSYPKPRMISIRVRGRPVSWRSFLTQFTLVDTDGNDVGTFWGDEIQAHYAVYAARPGQYGLEVPADTVVAGKAVQEYEQYLRQIGYHLFQRALEATRDYRQAERVARELLESSGLPPLAVSRGMGG